MKIFETIDYAATPEQVFAMVSNEDFQERKCVATGAVEHTVTITEDAGRTVVRTERGMPTEGMDLPSFINIGPMLRVVETQDWGPADPDGSREGRLTVELKGLPLSLKGTASMRPAGAGTVETLGGDLRANVPLIGGKVEKTAAPALVSGIRIEHETGQAWLAG